MLYTQIRDLFQDEVEITELSVVDIFNNEISIDEVSNVWKTVDGDFIHDSDLDSWLAKHRLTYEAACDRVIFQATKADFKEII